MVYGAGADNWSGRCYNSGMSTVGYIQFEPEFGEVTGNITRILALAHASSHADLLVFPELANSGYEFADDGEALEVGETFGKGPLSEGLCEVATAEQVTVVVGYAERDGDRAYNSSMMATPDGRLVNYRKLHLYSRETEVFSRGDTLSEVVETPAGRVGMMICFDWYFPETARKLALAGAQIIAHPSNLVMPYCQQAMYARCVENRVFSITANRFGTEDRVDRELTFTGQSQVLSPTGERLVFAPEQQNHVGLVEIDPAFADEKNINEYNHVLDDRRFGIGDNLRGTDR